MLKSQNWAIVIALLLVSPAMWIGLQLDDYFHWSLVTKQTLLPATSDQAGIFGLFSFLDGEMDRTHELMNLGMVPWWTLDTVQYAFWRPVSELTHGIDYLFLSQWPWLMHVHGLWYFVLLLFFTAKLFEEIHGDKSAGRTSSRWAFWIFALSYTHGLPAAWLANRNAILATLFVVLTLRAHHKWRQSDHGGFFLLAAMFFIAGLLSGELAVSAGLYLFSYALFLDQGSLVRRMMSIVPYAFVGVIWLVVRAAMEYGAKNSGHYIDPGQDVVLFLQVFVERAVSLLSAQFFALPPELLSALPSQPKFSVQVILLVLLALVLIPFVIRDKIVRFWLAGLVLCILPVCATIPHSRLLMCVSLGAAGVLGVVLSQWENNRSPGHWLALPVILLLLFCQFIASPLLLPVEAASIRLGMDSALNNGARNLPITNENKNNTAILINPPMSSVAGYINGIRLFEGLPVAESTLPLVSGRKDIVLRVIDAYTLEIASENGLYDGHNEGLLRDPNQGFAAWDHVELSVMSVVVRRVNETGVPLVAHFHFIQPLNSAAMDFYIWAGGKPVLCELPAVNEEIVLTARTLSCHP